MKTVLAGESMLAYDEWGGGEPVVLVHGNFSSRRWWELVARQKPAGLRLIAPDLPGFGDSPMRDGEVSIDRYAQDLLQCADALALTQFWLVGLSLGGMIAQAVACRAPKRVRGLLLVSSCGPAGLPIPEESYALLSAMVGHPEMVTAAVATVTPFVPDKAWFREVADHAARMHPRLYTENARALGNVNCAERLARYRGPVLAIRGVLDNLVGEEHLAAIVAALPQARTEVWEGSGHSPPTDQPERFATLLRDFVGSRPPVSSEGETS